MQGFDFSILFPLLSTRLGTDSAPKISLRVSAVKCIVALGLLSKNTELANKIPPTVISGICVILRYYTVALRSNRRSSVAWLALGSESPQNFAVLAIFLSSPIHKEPQHLESDIQMAEL